MKSENPGPKKREPQKPPATKAAAPAAPAKPKPPFQVPPSLLEGDAPSAPSASGPGQRYVLAPAPVAPSAAKPGEASELPEAYGTKRLHLTARDPHWLYAHWDLSREQLKHYNGLSASRHLVLPWYKTALSDKPFDET